VRSGEDEPLLPEGAVRFPVGQEKKILLALVDSCFHKGESNGTNNALMRCMIALVRLGERFPEEKERAAALAEKMIFTHQDMPEIGRHGGRILTASSWQHARFVTSEEGIRFAAATEDWTPDTPALQHRKALLGLNQGEQILFDAKPLILDMDNLSPADLQITLTLEEMPYAPPQPLVLFLQKGKKKPERYTLSHENPQLVKRLQLASGHHQVTLALKERYANQFLRVRFHESGKDGEAPEWSHHKEKSYYVSTRKHPVRIRVQGPALIRADEYQGEKKKASVYHFVDMGWHKIELPPSRGRESLFRVFRRVPDSGTGLALELPKEAIPTEVSEPLFSLADIRTDKPVPDDAYPPGIQEDGTWEWRAGLHKRRNVQEDTDAWETEDFLQLGVTHRYFQEAADRYFRTNGLIRFREHGGPVAGLRHQYHRLLGYRPLAFTADAALFVQAPAEDEQDSTALTETATEMSFFVQAALAGRYHLGQKSCLMPKRNLR
ncbi:MAG: hypothetical protein D3909_15235, partial [Candidatus Electrothrix sp. ATG1]|nr:hypothetical protein [Candidatus Electrothrix sp. ATG1]